MERSIRRRIRRLEVQALRGESLTLAYRAYHKTGRLPDHPLLAEKVLDISRRIRMMIDNDLVKDVD